MSVDLDLNAELEAETSEEVPAFDVSQLVIHPPLSLIAWRRRATIVDVLDSFEEVTRYRQRFQNEAQAVATWDAVWQFRVDVLAALDRLEEAERSAR